MLLFSIGFLERKLCPLDWKDVLKGIHFLRAVDTEK
jgi:hypothetical protein